MTWRPHSNSQLSWRLYKMTLWNGTQHSLSDFQQCLATQTLSCLCIGTTGQPLLPFSSLSNGSDDMELSPTVIFSTWSLCCFNKGHWLRKTSYMPRYISFELRPSLLWHCCCVCGLGLFHLLLLNHLTTLKHHRHNTVLFILVLSLMVLCLVCWSVYV